MLSRRKASALFVIACFAIISFAPGMYAYPGGYEDAADVQYGCGDGCHETISASTISMSATKTELTPGETVSVTVTVDGAEADGSPLGVLLLSSLNPTGSLPSDAGWTIISDPLGSAHNYVQVDDYQESASLTWSMQAPSTEGAYALYAQELHGDGSRYVNDFSAGLMFAVGEVEIPVSGVPVVTISSPTSGTNLSGKVTVVASVVSSTPVEYAILKVDCLVVDNKSEAPFSWEIDTESYADGLHVVNITVVDEDGGKGYKEVIISVNNAEKKEEMLAWITTMVVGSIAIVAAMGVLVVVALVIRRRVVGKEGS